MREFLDKHMKTGRTSEFDDGVTLAWIEDNVRNDG